jgi:hypothetical protein
MTHEKLDQSEGMEIPSELFEAGPSVGENYEDPKYADIVGPKLYDSIKGLNNVLYHEALKKIGEELHNRCSSPEQELACVKNVYTALLRMQKAGV